MALLLNSISSPDEWLRAFRKEMPNLEVCVWPVIGDPAEIEFAAVANLPKGQLAQFPNLRLIMSLIAGMDRLLSDPSLPPSVPIVRVGDLDEEGLMTDFIVTHVLRHHCDLPHYQAGQSQAQWVPRPRRLVRDRRVGLMGLGSIGLTAASKLADYGFDVAGWVRNIRSVKNIQVFYGPDQLRPFLERSDIVVNVLPLTAETRDIFNKATLSMLPKEAALINVGRGGTIVDEDLIEMLDSGHIGSATLDVFRTEPLPATHAFWRHPRITITPHVARNLNVTRVVARAVAYVHKVRAGTALDGLVNRQAGY